MERMTTLDTTLVIDDALIDAFDGDDYEESGATSMSASSAVRSSGSRDVGASQRPPTATPLVSPCVRYPSLDAISTPPPLPPTTNQSRIPSTLTDTQAAPPLVLGVPTYPSLDVVHSSTDSFVAPQKPTAHVPASPHTTATPFVSPSPFLTDPSHRSAHPEPTAQVSPRPHTTALPSVASGHPIQVPCPPSDLSSWPTPQPLPAATAPLHSSETEDVDEAALQIEILDLEQRLDYVAQALAGTTPHQIEARRRREAERLEREERRLEALEARVDQRLEHAQQREARRLKVLERVHTHRTSQDDPSSPYNVEPAAEQ